MDVLLQGPRYTLERTADGIRVVIPSRKNWFVILFFSFWLCGWFVGESTAIAELFGHPFSGKVQPPGFLGIWLLFWTFGGIAVFATLVWQFAGRELIALSSITLTQRVEAFGLGRSRSYRADEIRDLRASTNAFIGYARWGRTGLPFGGGGAGPFVFDYGARTIRMAAGLDEAEAKMMVKEFSTRLKGKQQ
jgi:hypothetical protein